MHSQDVFAINDGFYTFVLLFLQSKSPRPHFRRALSKTSFTVLFDRDAKPLRRVNAWLINIRCRKAILTVF